MQKIDGCKNNPEKLFTTKVSKHNTSGISRSTISLFKDMENKHYVYRDKDFMEKFREPSREHEMKLIYFKKKRMKLLTNDQGESYKNAKMCYICKENLKTNMLKNVKNMPKYRKVRDHCHYAGE